MQVHSLNVGVAVMSVGLGTVAEVSVACRFCTLHSKLPVVVTSLGRAAPSSMSMLPVSVAGYFSAVRSCSAAEAREAKIAPIARTATIAVPRALSLRVIVLPFGRLLSGLLL